MAGAGIKIYADGEKEFKAALREINAELKTNTAEMKLLSEQYKNSDGDISLLTEKQQKLRDSMDAQAKKTREIEEQMDEAKETFGENSKQVQNLSDQLIRSKTEYEKLRGELTKSIAEIEAAEEAQASMAGEVELSDAKIAAFAATIKEMEAELKAGEGAFDKTGDAAAAFEKKAETLRKENDLLTATITEQEKKIEALNKDMERAVKLYGEESREVLDYKRQISDAKTEVHNLTARINQNNESLEEGTEKAIDLKDALGELGGIEGLGGLTGALEKIAGSLATPETLAVAIAAAVAKVTIGAGEAAEEIDQMADKMGIAASEADKWKQFMESIGYESSSLEDLMKDFQQSIYDAVKGDEEKTTIFRDLGIDLQEMKISAEQAYQTILSMPVEDIEEKLVAVEAGIAGIGTEAIDVDAVLKKYGGDVKQYAINLWNAIRGGGETQEASDQLEKLAENLGVTSLETRDAIDVFPEMLDALGKMQNETEKAGIQTKIFGENWRNATKLFDYTGEQIEKTLATFEAYSDATIAANKQVAESWDMARQQITAAVDGISVAVSGLMQWDFERAGEGLQRYISNINKLSGTDDMSGWQKVLSWISPVGKLLVNVADGISTDKRWDEMEYDAKVRASSVLPYERLTNYNVTVDASSIKELTDIARLAENARVKERMG